MSFLTHRAFRSSKVTSQNGNAALRKPFLQESELGVIPFLSHYGISKRDKTTPVTIIQPSVNDLSIDTDVKDDRCCHSESPNRRHLNGPGAVYKTVRIYQIALQAEVISSDR